MGAVEFRVDGAPEWWAAVEKMRFRVRAATDQAVNDGLHEIQVRAQQNLVFYSHPRGTPTPSAPGEPPALISGALRRSIKVRRTKRGPGLYEGKVGPTIIYGRIQELGGRLGHNPRHGMWRQPGYLPPRPYLRPAVIAVLPKIRSIFLDAWSRAIRG